jgi:hypothetical protein
LHTIAAVPSFAKYSLIAIIVHPLSTPYTMNVVYLLSAAWKDAIQLFESFLNAPGLRVEEVLLEYTTVVKCNH